MAISLQSISRGGSDRAPLIVLHGPPGIGKTTFASSADSPIFIRTEDGLGGLEVDTFPESESVSDVMESLAALYEDGHGYQTVVIDSLSALEPLIWKQVASDHGKDNLEDLGFGKGYIYAMDYWREVIEACKGLAKRGIMPILIAHTDIVKFDSPEADPYDRYQIKLHKRAFQYLYEQADIIGFAAYPVHVKTTDKSDKGKGVKKGERELTLVERPALIAKNRYSMPETVPLEWDAFAAHLPNFTTHHKEQDNG